MADVHITPEGLEAVEKELDELTSQKRPSIVAKIKAARELGDLSENFEYHAAKNEQGMMEARIKELESIIKNHVLIEARTEKGVVGMGNTVRFAEDGADEERYRIVGPAEADPKAGRVSYESALGKALIGHRVGDEVDINAARGAAAVDGESAPRRALHHTPGLDRLPDWLRSQSPRAPHGSCGSQQRSDAHRARARTGKGERARDECQHRRVARRRRRL